MPSEPVTMMQELISLDYRRITDSVSLRFARELLKGRIIGHRAKRSGRVYVPPRGYCALTGEVTTEEVEVSDRGTVTAFTIVTPIDYYGQKETRPYIHASVLLDGASSTLTGIRVEGIPHEDMCMGLRVRADWKDPSERHLEYVQSWGYGALSMAVSRFVPSGEPDADPSTWAGHVF